MVEVVRIQQALFGYHEGHHLIAGSVELDSRSALLLATVTDASGPEASKGFETSITGLPVPGTGYYALFQTWPAPEMSRPGCVWSHVLLIELADLARISNLAALLDLFRRPKNRSKFSEYGLPLQITSAPDVDPQDRIELDRARWLLSHLYQSQKELVVLDHGSMEWGKIVFAIWSQQWPRLRRNFSFSTGSLADRRIMSVPFDLQIAPLQSERLWPVDEGLTTVLRFDDSRSPIKSVPWLDAAMHDLVTGPAGLLRQFFFRFGSDVSPSRIAFVPLTRAFLPAEEEEESDIGAHLRQTAVLFPKADEAVTLKKTQLSDLSPLSPDNLDRVWGATYFLLTSNNSDAFRQIAVDIDSWTSLLWQSKRSDVLGLLSSLHRSERTEAFLNALAQAISHEELPIIAREQPEFLRDLAARRPLIATEPKAWAMSGSGQQLLWDALDESTDNAEIWSKVVGAMLRADCAIQENQSVKLSGTFISETLASWLTSPTFRLPAPGWRSAFKTALMDGQWQPSADPPLFTFAIWLMPPRVAAEIDGHREDVQKLLSKLGDVPKPLLLHTQFWLVAVGLKTSGRDGARLLAAALIPVYDALSRSDYAGISWDVLTPLLPDSLMGPDWDRCKRLRRGLRNWIDENEREATAIPSAFREGRHDDMLRYIRHLN